LTLEIRVESAASGGLKIINHIPPQRPCRLEGRNGIGKSALIRLLVLVSGVQPYPGQPGPWRSLRNLIGSTVITIEGLTGEHSSARIQLTPDIWPPDPLETIGDWLGVLTLDGTLTPLQRLFELLDIVHLSGTERLADTLKQQTGRLAVALSEVAHRLNAIDNQRAELGELEEQLQFVSTREADSERLQQERATAERRQLQETLQAAKLVVDDLSRATALTALVETGDAAEHQRQLQELRPELETARQRLQAAEAKHEKAVAALAKGTAAQRQVAQFERRLGTIKKSMDGLLARQEELGARLESLQIPTEVDALDAEQRETLDKALAALNERQRRLHILAARNRRTNAENQLLDDVRVVLDDAAEHGLGDTVLARVNNHDITVTEFRDGLGFLSTVEAADLEELAAVNRDLAELSELKELFVKRASLQEDGDKLRVKLQRLEVDIAGHDELHKEASRTRAEVDAASTQVRSHMVKIGSLSRSALGGTDVRDVKSLINDLLNKHAVEPSQLSTALTKAQTTVLGLQTRNADLTEEIERLSANATRRRIQRETLRRQSRTEEKLNWLGQLAELMTPTATDRTVSSDWPDETWQRMSDHITASRKALGKLFTEVSGLQAIAAQTTSPTSRLGQAIKAVSEADALAELSAEPIADALFDGGIVRRVSLDDESITWTTPAGETRTRPLAAFSSGEQALGFMRARLQQIANEREANRLIFLDEFGAFISADRRRPLAELLTSDELQALTEQVVVVLPLQADYASELNETTGTLHEVYAKRARAVIDQGYFTEVFMG
jgi:hypothetical protein